MQIKDAKFFSEDWDVVILSSWKAAVFLCGVSDLSRPEKWKLGKERNIVPILRLGSFSTGSWKNLHNLI